MQPILIEQYNTDGLHWIVSFNGSNPTAEESVEVANHSDAQRLIRILSLAHHGTPSGDVAGVLRDVDNSEQLKTGLNLYRDLVKTLDDCGEWNADMTPVYVIAAEVKLWEADNAHQFEKWIYIPTLPDDEARVLITISIGGKKSVVAGRYYANTGFVKNINHEYSMHHVIAWQYLPAPAQGFVDYYQG